MYEKLLKTVKNLGSPRVLLAGDFMLDVYIYGDALRISPEAPVPVLKVTKTDYSCGGAGSVANALGALGAVPVCIGAVGDDENGKILTGKLAEIGSDLTGMLTIHNRPTTSKQRLIGLAQHRHQQQLFRMDEESDEPLSAEQYEGILTDYKGKLQNCDIVCLQDYNKGFLTAPVCKKMIQLAAKANKKVLVDPALAGNYSKYSGATLITPNRQETSEAIGFKIETEDDAGKAADELAKKLNLKAVVITLDKQGAYLWTQKQGKIIPTIVRNVYDVTGAGDMVLATLAITLAADCDYETAVQLSNITSGIEVEKFGAATVTVDEVIDEILSRKTGKGDKIYSADDLIEKLSRHRSRKETIVFTNGCFDVVHRGHIEFLKFCKSHGNVVVLGLNSDRSVKIIKGADRPINNESDRAAVLAAMETVDYITVFDEPDPLELIKKVKPDILVKGKDWEGKGVVGQEFVESYGGRVVLAPLVEGKSTTSVVEKVKSLWKKS